MTDTQLDELFETLGQDRSGPAKVEFIKYMSDHPQERFWQSIRNFSKFPFVFVSELPMHIGENDNKLKDTFYWETKNGN